MLANAFSSVEIHFHIYNCDTKYSLHKYKCYQHQTQNYIYISDGGITHSWIDLNGFENCIEPCQEKSPYCVSLSPKLTKAEPISIRVPRVYPDTPYIAPFLVSLKKGLLEAPFLEIKPLYEHLIIQGSCFQKRDFSKGPLKMVSA